MSEPLKIHSTKYLLERLKENFYKFIEAYAPDEGTPQDDEARDKARVEFYAMTSGTINTLVMVIDKQGERIRTLEDQVKWLMEKARRKGLDK